MTHERYINHHSLNCWMMDGIRWSIHTVRTCVCSMTGDSAKQLLEYFMVLRR